MILCGGEIGMVSSTPYEKDKLETYIQTIFNLWLYKSYVEHIIEEDHLFSLIGLYESGTYAHPIGYHWLFSN